MRKAVIKTETLVTLSVAEPWLSMIYSGEKTIETRSWMTHHRGDLLLAGCAKPPGQFAGLAPCIVNLVDCRPMTDDDEEAACCYRNRFAWVFDNLRKIKPVKITGQQRLYKRTITVESAISIYTTGRGRIIGYQIVVGDKNGEFHPKRTEPFAINEV